MKTKKICNKRGVFGERKRVDMNSQNHDKKSVILKNNVCVAIYCANLKRNVCLSKG